MHLEAAQVLTTRIHAVETMVVISHGTGHIVGDLEEGALRTATSSSFRRGCRQWIRWRWA